jgi:hypothetical protein
MPNTPQEIATLHPQRPEVQNWLFNKATTIRNMQEYLRIIAYRGYGSTWPFTLAKLALRVRISEQAAESSDKLSGQTDRLIISVGSLVVVAEEQKKLALKLEQQTNKLIRLSWAMVAFSVVLLAVALVQTKIMFKENSQTNVQHVQASERDQQPPTNQ